MEMDLVVRPDVRSTYPSLVQREVACAFNKINKELEQSYHEAISAILDEYGTTSQYQKWRSAPYIWIIALKLNRYGMIYPLSRKDACEYLKLLEGRKTDLENAYYFLSRNNRSKNIVNCAIQRFVANKPNRSVNFSNELIPKNAIYSVSSKIVYVRRNDYNACPVFRHSKINAEALYDFHDFSHFVASAINEKLYGSKYFNSLIKLPQSLKALIKSKDQNEDMPLNFSDGLV